MTPNGVASFPAWFSMKQAGFSLIEVLVSVMILCIGSAAALGMMQAGRIGLSAGQKTTYAMGLGQAKMEESLALPYVRLAQAAAEERENIGTFTRIRRIFRGMPRSNSLTVQVTVEWKRKTGRPHRVILSSVRVEGVVP